MFDKAIEIIDIKVKNIIVPTPLVGEGTKYSNGFFCSDNFEELSSYKISCEHGIFGSLLFTFIVIFVRINIFSIKMFVQNYLSRYKRHQFGVPNRQKAIKKTSSGLIGKFTMEKSCLRAVFLENFFLFLF